MLSPAEFSARIKSNFAVDKMKTTSEWSLNGKQQAHFSLLLV